MKPAHRGGPTTQARRSQRAWHSLPLGRRLLAGECAQLERVLPDLFGYHLLQLGHPAGADLTGASRIMHRMVMEGEWSGVGRRHYQAGQAGLIGAAQALPIAADSVDVVILPHSLEFEDGPHQVLREAERVLIPEGHLIVLGFNPWSLWGLWRIALRRSGRPPWCGRFLGTTRLKDWLALLGFDTLEVRYYFFRPPLQSETVMQKLDFLERLGERYWPRFAGAYLLLAKKRVATLTPIKPRWSAQRLVRAGVAEPSRFLKKSIHGFFQSGTSLCRTRVRHE